MNNPVLKKPITVSFVLWLIYKLILIIVTWVTVITLAMSWLATKQHPQTNVDVYLILLGILAVLNFFIVLLGDYHLYRTNFIRYKDKQWKWFTLSLMFAFALLLNEFGIGWVGIIIGFVVSLFTARWFGSYSLKDKQDPPLLAYIKAWLTINDPPSDSR
ncbi:hypothetical protein [Moraxella marmotae]|uniref:hypothetical protein n=1 Tax=Moraxella marmotae TaxID=3344520 RepID=UPI0035F29D57